MSIDEDMKYILKRHEAVLGGEKNFPGREEKFDNYAVSIFRGGIGKTTLAFNLAYEMQQHDPVLVADVCPQRNLSELLLAEDANEDDPDIYDALLPAVTAGFKPPAGGTLGMRISQSCRDFRFGKPSYAINGSNSLFLFASSLYGALSALSVLPVAKQKKSTAKVLYGLKRVLSRESRALGTKKTLIDTSPFFGGATHLAWMAAEALIVPVRVDRSSLDALELTLRMLSDDTMDFLRYARSAGLEDTAPRIHVIAMTHCGWSRTRANTPDQSTQAFVSEVIRKIGARKELFTTDNPLDAIVLLDDFHSSGRISGATRTPMARLKAGKFETVQGKRLQVNDAVDRYKLELSFLANML